MTTEQFNKLSRQEKAVLVAKDVLAQLKTKRYTANAGSYIKDTIKEDFKGSIQKNFNKIKECKVCALGACLLSSTKLGNILTTDDLYLSDYSSVGVSDLDNKNIKKLLKSIFTPSQMYLIESAFEGFSYDSDRVAVDIFKQKCNDKIEHVVNSFHRKYDNDKERLIAIMENIISNNGVFKI